MPEVVFRTSGSTGPAKEIVRTEASLQEDARRLVAAFPEVWKTPSGDRPLVVASVLPEHMYGALWRVRAPALAGCPTEPSTILSVEDLNRLAAARRPLVFVTTPSFLEKAILHPDFNALTGAFRAIVTSGSPLRRETALAVRDITGACPLEIYGSTEAGTVAWRRQAEQDDTFALLEDVRAWVAEDGRLAVDSPHAMERPLALGDLAEMRDARHFALKGRADRRVKILESFVSLPEVEAALAAHPFVGRVRVESFGEGVPRLGALIVPSAAGVGAAARDDSTALSSALRAFLKGKLADCALPRRFRFVRALPTDARGKTTVAAVRAALGAWCREPLVTRWQATADRLEAELVFTRDMECFRGHFPGFPILPGVAQLFFLRHFARQAFGDWPESATFRKLKFQKIVRPGVPVTLRVTRGAAGTLAFEFTLASGRSTSGRLESPPGAADPSRARAECPAEIFRK